MLRCAMLRAACAQINAGIVKGLMEAIAIHAPNVRPPLPPLCSYHWGHPLLLLRMHMTVAVAALEPVIGCAKP